MRFAHIACLASLTGLAACANVDVAPGHGLVVMAPDGTLTGFGEGAVAVDGASRVDDFDLREQVQGGQFTAITADGVPLVIANPTVSYALAASELVAIDRDLGPASWGALVDPVVRAAVARVIAGYTWGALTPSGIRHVQARITAEAAATLRPHHLILSSVELKGIVPRLPAFAAAVTDTAVWEQRAAEAKTHVELARHRADDQRVQAQGVAAAFDGVAPTLSPAVLEQQRQEAWRRLVTSSTSTVIVADPDPPGSPASILSPATAPGASSTTLEVSP